MSDVLCMYYSRTGNTKKAMEEIAQALDAELVELKDGVDRSGLRGWFRCGLDAMSRTCRPLESFSTQKALKRYRLVILGSPVWAGRCSSVIRSFLKTYGRELGNVAYVVTRGSEGKYSEVFDQMDLYTALPRVAEVSLQSGSVGYTFWQEEFLRKVREHLGAEK